MELGFNVPASPLPFFMWMSAAGIWNYGISDPLPPRCLFLITAWHRITATTTKKKPIGISGSFSPADSRYAAENEKTVEDCDLI